MKTCLYTLVLAVLLPLAAAAAEKPRAMFGVVTDDMASLSRGVLVRSVRPESPALKLGLLPGDVILSMNGCAISSKEELRAVLLTMEPGQSLEVEWQRGAEIQRISVVLAERPVSKKRGAASANAAVGGDRMLRPLRVELSIREAMREHRREVIRQLSQLPDGLVPAEVSDHLQSIRNLARDANPNGRGWMLGEAGEVTLQLRDADGVLVLHGANNQLTLTVYDAKGEVTHILPLNTTAERQAVPQAVIERLQKLR